MRPPYESVLQRRTYKNHRSIQRRSSKNREGSSESGVLRLEEGWSGDEQPMGDIGRWKSKSEAYTTCI